MTRPRNRLYIDAALRPGLLAVAGGQHHYLAHVLRAKAGEAVALFNGSDGEWRAEILQVGKRELALQLTERLHPQPPVTDGPWLAFAPIKQHMEFLVQKATELGAAKLCPVITQHTVMPRVNLERLRENAIQAAEQCERLEVPEILEPVKFDAFLASSARMLIYGDETGAGLPVREMLATLPAGGVSLLVGPEGGFAEAELTALRAAKRTFGVGLGPRILRADTAAIALLAILQAEKGDWHGRPRLRG